MSRSSSSNSSSSGCGCGFGLGSVCAVVISSALNHSFWWGLLHFFFGWAYVLYALLVHTKAILPALRAMF